LLWLVTTVETPGAIFGVMLGYALCYNPTLALVNAISFNQMKDPGKQFPSVRVFGTVGWIVASGLAGYLAIEAEATPFLIAAGSSAVLGLYAFFLPETPPKALGRKVTIRDVLGLDALSLMRDRSFAVFVMGSILTCIPLAFYFSFTNAFLNDMGIVKAALKMTMGQMSEIVFMLVMPFFFVRLGVKRMLLVGMLAWAGRYLLFAFGNAEELVAMYYLGILLHGICYDFFFVTGQIYVDKTAPKAVQASAQGFITLVTYGLGMLIGNWVSGPIVDHYTTEVAGRLVREWTTIWLWPAALAVVGIVLFGTLFREKPQTTSG
jgi:nucleoside transporter